VLLHKYYVDELYDALVVNRVKDLGTWLGIFDAKVIDGVGVDGTGWLMRYTSKISMWWDKWVIDGLLKFRREANAAFQLSDPAFANRIVFQLRDADSARSGGSAGVLRAPYAYAAARGALRGEEWTFLHIIS